MIEKTDYEEPRCPLCSPGTGEPIPVGRVLEKLDFFLAREETDRADRHLRYWLAEADASGDLRGKLTVLNECVGLARKTGREADALSYAREAVGLAGALGLSEHISTGTTLLNAATAYKAFGHAEDALPLYERAKALYEKELSPDDERLGGLYNNMGLALLDTGAYRAAEEMLFRALSVMEKIPDAVGECAVTLCNLADVTAAEKGLEEGDHEIRERILQALAYLMADVTPDDADFAYICEKCAPTVEYYGFFLDAAELREKAKRIRERISS